MIRTSNSMPQTNARTAVNEALDEMFSMWNDPYKAPEQKLSAGQGAINRIAEIISDVAVKTGIAPSVES